jgi:hypothetical protein
LNFRPFGHLRINLKEPTMWDMLALAMIKLLRLVMVSGVWVLVEPVRHAHVTEPPATLLCKGGDV